MEIARGMRDDEKAGRALIHVVGELRQYTFMNKENNTFQESVLSKSSKIQHVYTLNETASF